MVSDSFLGDMDDAIFAAVVLDDCHGGLDDVILVVMVIDDIAVVMVIGDIAVVMVIDDIAVVMVVWYEELEEVHPKETLVWTFGEDCNLPFDPRCDVTGNDEEVAGFGRTNMVPVVDQATNDDVEFVSPVVLRLDVAVVIPGDGDAVADVGVICRLKVFVESFMSLVVDFKLFSDFFDVAAVVLVDDHEELDDVISVVMVLDNKTFGDDCKLPLDSGCNVPSNDVEIAGLG
jgi:hypothetical protein